MRISVIAVGRLRPPYQDDVEHYRKLIGGHVRMELIEVREDEKVGPADPGAVPQGAARERRREMRLARVQPLAGGAPRGGRDVCFVIGGPRGLELEADRDCRSGG